MVRLHFRVRGPADGTIEDSYRVELRIPPSFPSAVPIVFETGGRVPKTYHKLTDGSLCLAAQTELRLGLGPSTTVNQFIERFVVPYLFGYSHFEKYGVAPVRRTGARDGRVAAALRGPVRSRRQKCRPEARATDVARETLGEQGGMPMRKRSSPGAMPPPRRE